MSVALDDVLAFDVVSERQAAGLVDLHAQIGWQVHTTDSMAHKEEVEK